MTYSLGLGIRIGTPFVGAEPVAEVTSPNALIQSASDISVVGSEALHPDDLISIFGSGNVQLYSSADIGITQSSNEISAWADRSTNARHWAQGGISATKPTYNASDNTLGGRASFSLNGTTQWLPNAWNMPAPGTTPFWYLLVAKHISRIATNASLFCTNSTGRLGVFDSSTSPNVRAGNGIANTADMSMTLNQWFVVEGLYANGATDYLHFGNNTQTLGSTFGNFDGNGLGLGARYDGLAAFGNYHVANFIVCSADPSGGTKTNAYNWINKWYKGNVTLPT